MNSETFKTELRVKAWDAEKLGHWHLALTLRKAVKEITEIEKRMEKERGVVSYNDLIPSPAMMSDIAEHFFESGRRGDPVYLRNGEGPYVIEKASFALGTDPDAMDAFSMTILGPSKRFTITYQIDKD